MLVADVHNFLTLRNEYVRNDPELTPAKSPNGEQRGGCKEAALCPSKPERWHEDADKCTQVRAAVHLTLGQQQ